MQRWKNYGLWVSLFSLIPMLLQAFGVVKIPENYNNLANALLGILVGAGIISSPTTENRGYLDDISQSGVKVENRW